MKKFTLPGISWDHNTLLIVGIEKGIALAIPYFLLKKLLIHILNGSTDYTSKQKGIRCIGQL